VTTGLFRKPARRHSNVFKNPDSKKEFKKRGEKLENFKKL
jgi:hypothetical protein